MDAPKSYGREKFPEPRAWALNWGDSTPPASPPAAEQAAPSRRKFPEPQGWALRWDGLAVSGAQEHHNGRTS